MLYRECQIGLPLPVVPFSIRFGGGGGECHRLNISTSGFVDPPVSTIRLPRFDYTCRIYSLESLGKSVSRMCIRPQVPVTNSLNWDHRSNLTHLSVVCLQSSPFFSVPWLQLSLLLHLRHISRRRLGLFFLNHGRTLLCALINSTNNLFSYLRSIDRYDTNAILFLLQLGWDRPTLFLCQVSCHAPTVMTRRMNRSQSLHRDYRDTQINTRYLSVYELRTRLTHLLKAI